MRPGPSTTSGRAASAAQRTMLASSVGVVGQVLERVAAVDVGGQYATRAAAVLREDQPRYVGLGLRIQAVSGG